MSSVLYVFGSISRDETGKRLVCLVSLLYLSTARTQVGQVPTAACSPRRPRQSTHVDTGIWVSSSTSTLERGRGPRHRQPTPRPAAVCGDCALWVCGFLSRLFPRSAKRFFVFAQANHKIALQLHEHEDERFSLVLVVCSLRWFPRQLRSPHFRFPYGFSLGIPNSK